MSSAYIPSVDGALFTLRLKIRQPALRLAKNWQMFTAYHPSGGHVQSPVRSGLACAGLRENDLSHSRRVANRARNSAEITWHGSLFGSEDTFTRKQHFEQRSPDDERARDPEADRRSKDQRCNQPAI